jgi:integrase
VPIVCRTRAPASLSTAASGGNAGVERRTAPERRDHSALRRLRSPLVAGGQRVLDGTRGNLKAVQKLLGHSSISTTGDIYTDWGIDQLTETLRGMLDEAER